MKGYVSMADKHNIIFIMPDQLRPDFLSCHGASFIQTPNIDSLAKGGVLYTRAYSAHPLCVPARVSLMTGMDAVKNGVLGNNQFLRNDYSEMGIQCLAEILGANGYYTAAIGKMHFYPWDLRLGFQYRVIAEDKRWIHIRDDYHHFLRQNGYRKLHGNEHPGYFENKGAIVNRIPWEYQVDHFVGQEACRFIEQNGGESPFMMMVGFPGPHCPYDPDPRFLERFSPEEMPDPIPESEGDAPGLRQRTIEANRQPWNGVDFSEFPDDVKRKIRAHYAALVSQIDYEIGQILDALQKRKLLDNTIIIFSSDHGDYLGDHNLIGKGHFFESSMHVPLIVRLPGSGDSLVCDEMVALSDVTATMLKLAGCEVPSHMDSRPLPALGIPDATGRDCIVGMIKAGWMIYDGRWRLSKYSTGETLLFDIREDPLEQRNLIRESEYAEIYRNLDSRLTQSIMHSIEEANHDRMVYTKDLASDDRFGREGWKRPYPRTHPWF